MILLSQSFFIFFFFFNDTATTEIYTLSLHDALPIFYFPPVVINGRRLGDGGLRAVLALEGARSIPADLVVAAHGGPGFDEPPPPPSTALHRLLPPPLIRAHGEAIRIIVACQSGCAMCMGT